VDADTVRLDPLTDTVGLVAQLPLDVVQKPLPAIVSAVGVPKDE
jgi:hypothetical protein